MGVRSVRDCSVPSSVAPSGSDAHEQTFDDLVAFRLDIFSHEQQRVYFRWIGV